MPEQPDCRSQNGIHEQQPALSRTDERQARLQAFEADLARLGFPDGAATDLWDAWDDAEAEVARLRAANAALTAGLEAIRRGVWTAPNSVDTMVWMARRALDAADALDGGAGEAAGDA